MIAKSEFSVQDAYTYDRRSATHWAISHVWRYKGFLLAFCLFVFGSLTTYSLHALLIGQAAEELLQAGAPGRLLWLSLAILSVLVLDGVCNLSAYFCGENIAKRFQRDARQELYISLLGKSQTFHNRQRVGDIMARATDDVGLLSDMIVPGASLIYETFWAIVIPIFLIGTIRLELTLVPLLFVAVYILAVRDYARRLNPVANLQREQFGAMNAGLEETISGIEVVKASAREIFERGKFQTAARRIRDLFVRQGRIEAGYLPLLLFAIAIGLEFLHAIWLYQLGRVSIAHIIGVMGLMNVLRFPTFISIWSFSVVQAGLASCERILKILRTATDLDENAGGLTQPVHGEIIFENVSFSFDERPLLWEVSFRVQPGQTVAIVGQTGSGKTALTQLVNRTYEANTGRVLIDGVDVRDWSMASLRSQVSKIEQDIFLFSRTIGENIAFGRPGATQVDIEGAARAAQAHDFILSFKDGYTTVVGERGVTLSGGQRQRIALARAFLSNPPILILDDSTSAIDSATEDEIQKALRRIQSGRTTLLITHRLSQIRWADVIVVLDQGRLVASGTHEALLHSSKHYRRIFARYDVALPPLATTGDGRPTGETVADSQPSAV